MNPILFVMITLCIQLDTESVTSNSRNNKHWKTKIENENTFVKRCMIAAHRGVNSTHPENTISAIQEAIRLQCDYVEIDVRTTKDGYLILMHDSNAKRTTGIDAPVRELTLNQLRDANAGEWFNSIFAEEKVPTLEEILKITKNKINIYLDNKDTNPNKLIQVLTDMEMLEDTVIYGNIDELEKIYHIESNSKLMPPLRETKDIESITSKFKPYAFDVRWESLSPELIKACHKKGIYVFSDGFSHNESFEKYKQAIEWGIDLIQTDNPKLLINTIESFSHH